MTRDKSMIQWKFRVLRRIKRGAAANGVPGLLSLSPAKIHFLPWQVTHEKVCDDR